MSPRIAAALWGCSGLFFAFIALAILGGCGFWLWHTHSSLTEVETRLDDADKELKRMRNLKRALTKEEARKFGELDQVLDSDTPKVAELSKWRSYALGSVLTFIIPAFIGFSLLIMALTKFMKARKAEQKAAEAENGDEDETEEEPERPRKSKKKSDDDD